MTAEANPNGSLDNIAGICNRARNVVGLMPHPERACESALGSADGKIVLESVVVRADRAGRRLHGMTDDRQAGRIDAIVGLADGRVGRRDARDGGADSPARSASLTVAASFAGRAGGGGVLDRLASYFIVSEAETVTVVASGLSWPAIADVLRALKGPLLMSMPHSIRPRSNVTASPPTSTTASAS